MNKIIDLDIDGTLTGDTRISEIAMVNMPAIEQDFIYFSEEKSFIVPQNISSKACKARKYKEENGTSCGTPVGWTRSSQLCSRSPISLDTVKRMYSYLSRHKVDLESSKSYDDGCGLLMYDAWGGEPAFDWAKRIVERQEDMDIDVSNLPEYVNYPTGDTKDNMLIEDVGFIEKVAGEPKDDYISRCVEYHIKSKGMDRDQSVAICISQADDAFAAGQRVSFEYQGVLTTPRGRGLLLSELQSGSDVYIISSTGFKSRILPIAKELGIPESKVFATGNDTRKLTQIKTLRINKHYDKDEDFIDRVGSVGIDFNCGCLDEFAEVGPRGGIRKSPKAPKSDTPNPNPKGKGTAKGDASTTRGAKVSAAQEKTLQGKVDDFNEKDSNTKNGRATLGALKSVFQRGLGAFNTSRSPNVRSAEQWAYARVNAYLYLLKNGRPENPKYVTDNDLLPKDHPKSGKEKMSMETLDVYGYKTKDFDICPGAIDTFTHLVDMNLDEETQGMVRSAAQIADNVFRIEKDVLELKSSTPEQLEQAKLLVDDFYDLMNEIDKIIGMEHPVEYMDGHIKVIESYLSDNEEFSCVSINGCECRLFTDENGNEVYVPHETEPVEELSFGIEEYSDDEIQAAILLQQLKEIDFQAFERIVGNLRGASLSEIKRRNHQTPTPYYLYKRVLEGSPDRDFCMSIENRYFTRFEIDLLTDKNKEFGHKRQPYSKWLYLGGPNCVHGWARIVAIGSTVREVGMVPGLPGTPMKSRPLQGYMNEETRAASKRAYVIEQKEKGNFAAQEEKRMIYGPLMIPNILIPRMDDNNEKYFVRFKPETIEKMQQLYMLEKRLDKTNYEHSNKKLPSVVMVESWIVSGDSDKSYELGFKKEDITKGTWMGGFKVLDTKEGDMIWNDFIKTGKLKGFSVEGDFMLKFSRQKNNEYLLDEIISIINKINN